MRSIAIMKGISATGKGTRLTQFMKYLESKMEYKILAIEANNHFRLIGRYYPEVNLLFIGRWVQSRQSKLFSWSSSDSLISNMMGYEALNGVFVKGFDIVKALIQNTEYNLAFEGYPGLIDPEMDVTSLSDNFDNGIVNYYYYNEFNDLIERTRGRSGEPCKGKSAWSSQNGVKSNRLKNQNLLDANNLEGRFTINEYAFDSDVTNYGCDTLRLLGREDLIEDFKKYSDDQKYLRHFSDKESNEAHHLKAYQEQQYRDNVVILPKFLRSDMIVNIKTVIDKATGEFTREDKLVDTYPELYEFCVDKE